MTRRIGMATLAVALVGGCLDSGPPRIRCDDLPCVGGTCAGTMVGTGHVERLRADATRLYWIDLGDPLRPGDEALLAMPLAGGEITRLAAASQFTSGLHVNQQLAIWSNTAGINSVLLTPPMTAELVSHLGGPYGFGFDDDAVYVGELNPKGVLRTTLVDHTSSLLTTSAPPLDVLVHGGDVFFTTCSGVSRVPTTGGTPDPLVTGECAIKLAASPTALFWWSFSENDAYAIRTFDLATRTERRLLATPETDGDIVAIEADDTDLYFASDTAICRIPAAGGDAVKVAEGNAFTLTADAIYWSTPAGEILRRPK